MKHRNVVEITLLLDGVEEAWTSSKPLSIAGGWISTLVPVGQSWNKEVLS